MDHFNQALVYSQPDDDGALRALAAARARGALGRC